MRTVELANDLEIKVEAVPGSVPAAYFAIEDSGRIAATDAGKIVVSGTVHEAVEVAGSLSFQMQLQVLGSADGMSWGALGSPVASLIATRVEAGVTRSNAPNRFVAPALPVAGWAWLRVRWALYPVGGGALADGQSVKFTCHAGLGLA